MRMAISLTKLRTSGVAVLLLWGSCLSAVLGQLPRIRLASIHPAGGQVDSTFPVTIKGELTEAASGLVFSHPDIQAAPQFEPATEFRTSHRKSQQFHVHVGPHVPPGQYDVRAIGPAGLSAPRSFLVSRLANVEFKSDGNSRSQPFAIEVGQGIDAKSRVDRRDYFVFTAQQHRPLLIQVFAERVDSLMDAVLAIYDQESGQRLVKSRQSLGRDPIVTFDAPHDGAFVIELSDATYRGDLSYRLEVSETPWIEGIHPMVGQQGVESTFAIYGYNLPGGIPVSGFERMGQLQSAHVTFTPDFGAKADHGGVWQWMNRIARAKACGQRFQLPERYLTAPRVFLAESRTAVTVENQATPEHPQVVHLPATIAGQFYPRHDRDAFQFHAVKGQTYWIELTSDQLGIPTDPAIRIQRKIVTGEQVTYRNLATADDLEGAPGSRDTRRFFTGTPDAALRFQTPDDGDYVVSVVDQYNAALDDPRLTYTLTIQPEAPDFALVAFAEPERFPDDKISRPNGIGLLPGGSAVVRVRLLPKQGFGQSVTVRAQGIPPGVEASELVLSPAMAEGFFVLQANPKAEPTLSRLDLMGECEVNGQSIRRVARSAAIIHGVDNLDNQATKSRLTDDLPLAVLDVKPAPARIIAPAMVATSRGAKTNVQIQLPRRDDFQDTEITVSAIQAPTGVKIDAAKSKTDALDVTIQVVDPKLAPGRYSVVLGAKLKDQRPTNPNRVAEWKADVDKLRALLTDADRGPAPPIDVIKKELAAAEKRWQDSRKSDLNKEAEFWIFGQPITVDVQAMPVNVRIDRVTIQPEATTDIPVQIERKFGFTGQVTLQAEFPDSSGLASSPVVLGKGVTVGKLMVVAEKGATSPPKRLKMQLRFNGQELSHTILLPEASGR